jgi:GTPase Era involved in 16S rRNA processing
MMVPTTIALSLVSHTNVGKTTLARTLLGRDIGEVRDEAHVTEAAEAHGLVESATGDRLMLWDTPGFGDSLRLARRLAQAGNPIGWFLSEVWDRWRDRAFWSSQRALRNVLEQADVVLYLVNASEAPEDAGYLDAELQVLALIGKPVIALLNQLGPAGAATDDEAQQIERWRARLHAAKGVHAVLPLDAFTRCWVQEGVLWQAVAGALPTARQAAFERLRTAWHQRQRATWQAAMAELAQRLARAALDREVVASQGWRGPLRTLGALLGLRSGDTGSASERAMAVLAERLDADVRRSTDALIRRHGLDGRAGEEVLARLARHYAVRQPLDEGRAALWGGLVTGALAGLKADIATGGLTLGGGLLAGGVIGALTAAGAAHGVNRVRGLEQPVVAWDRSVLDALLSAALLGYLAVAHHGRGRGAWVAQDPPAAWTAAVTQVLAERASDVAAVWQRREALLAQSGAAGAVDTEALLLPLQALLADLCARLLARLYPQAEPLAGA